MRRAFFCLIAFFSVTTAVVLGQEGGAELVAPLPQMVPDADPSGAKRFLADPGELVTLYGARRFGPYYEPGRAPPPIDPDTGWPLDGFAAPYALVGGPFYSPYRFSYGYGGGYYRSFYRPWYVPYGYGYGWGYRYPFGYPSYANRWSYYRPWSAYGLYRPWYAYPTYDWPPAQFGHDPSVIDHGIISNGPHEFGGCFFW